MIEVFKIVHGYNKNINDIYLFSHTDVANRDVPDSERPVLPAGNCVTGVYRYWPVLGCQFRYSANCCWRQHERRPASLRTYIRA